MKLSISLNKPKVVQPPVPIKRPSAFSLLDDGDTEDNGLPEKPQGKTESLAHNAHLAQTIRRRMEAEKCVDETVFEYDEVWDKMQEAKQRQQAAKDADASIRKPKYIHNLLTSAATRKLDHLRAEEKMMQLEREAEGDQFKDKESFVTQAYRDQMEEVRKAEEEEKKREELRKGQGRSSTGMTHFYRQLLEESEQKHEATVAATDKRVIGPQGPNVNLTIVKPPQLSSIPDAELARLARQEGKDVELNDDNQIVDKRELLSAGLNLSLPNTRFANIRNSANNPSTDNPQSLQTHRAVGTAASRKEINERRAREIQQQLEAEQQRTAQERQDAADKAIQRIVAKRNNHDDIEDARSRYFQRKRKKMEEEKCEDPLDP